MSSLRTAVLITLCALLVGCAWNPERLSRISAGMGKAQVIQELGTPTETSSADGVEVLRYSTDRASFMQHYFVRLEGGQVTEYGEMGQVGSAEIPGRER